MPPQVQLELRISFKWDILSLGINLKSRLGILLLLYSKSLKTVYHCLRGWLLLRRILINLDTSFFLPFIAMNKGHLITGNPERRI